MRDKYQKEIENRIESMGKGEVFSAKDFADIASQDPINKALSRLEQKNAIKRVMRGFYYVPEYSELIESYSTPRMDKVADAIARKYNWSIAPSGNAALNLLGLSTQVPYTWDYVSDGPNREYEILEGKLSFKKVKQREISGFQKITVTVIQAIREIGKGNITKREIEILKNNLSPNDKSILMTECNMVASWIYDIVKDICSDKGVG